MSKLLRAGFARLRREKVFWFALGTMTVLALLICLGQYNDMKQYGEEVETGRLLFQWTSVIGLVMAVFTGVYVGTEYSDGTIRNKLIVGHRRSHIYMTGFCLCTLTGLAAAACYLAVVCVLGIPLFGLPQLPAGMTAVLLFDSILLTAAYGALLNLIAMLIANRTHSSIACILFILLLMVGATVLLNMLQAEEFVQQISMSVNGEMVPQMEPNPRYLTGDKRLLFQFMADVIPTGQSFQIAGMNAVNPQWMGLYSAVLAVAANAAGLIGFRRKDLK